MQEMAGRRGGGDPVRIVHLDLAGFYTENTLYQTNQLARFHLRDGHEVTVISTAYRWEGAEIVKVPPCDMFVEGGVRLIRLEYANPDPVFAHQKVRKVKNLFSVLEALAPDIIFCHCLQFWSVLDVIRCKKAHPEAALYADTHAAAYNSGTSRLAVIGSIPEDRKDLLTSLMEADRRVLYLGWKSGEELEEYLCACDLYCQPGSVSATLQTAVCRGCPILSYPHEDYTKDLDYGNFIWAETEEDMAAAFRRIQEDPARLEALREGSRRCARELLDYRKLAARLYQAGAGEDGTKENESMNADHPGMDAPRKNAKTTSAPPYLAIYGNSASCQNRLYGKGTPDSAEAFPALRNGRTEPGVPSRLAPARQIGGVRP